jgi:hypothetical protein
MCVIILRNPGIQIPQAMLESACIVNPDGWGIAIADRGKLTLQKGLDKTNNPEVIGKILEDAKDLPLMLHLRYVTAGDRSLNNCHPFQSLKKDEDGIDVAFCHNGTLWQWKETGSSYSDSWHLNENFVRPLYQRVAKYTGPDEALKDEFAIRMLESEAGNNSLFGLIDGNGVQVAINHASGTEHEGWWSSNDYSFNISHREKKAYSGSSCGFVTNHNTTSTNANCNLGISEQEFWEKVVFDDDGKVSNVLPFAPDPPKGDTTGTNPFDEFDKEQEDELEQMALEELLEQGEKIQTVVKSMGTKRVSDKLAKTLMAENRLTFTDICKIDHISEMCRFDPEDLSELVVFYPEAAAVLLQDLLHELYLKNTRAAA